MMLMWCWELIEWLMRSWNWSEKLCQPTVTKSTMNGGTITMCPHDCRWFYGMLEINNGPINNHLTLEAFAVIHILKSFPQLKCEIQSLIHWGRRSTSVYQFCQLIKSTFFNRGLFKKWDAVCQYIKIYVVCSVTTSACCASVMRKLLRYHCMQPAVGNLKNDKNNSQASICFDAKNFRRITYIRCRPAPVLCMPVPSRHPPPCPRNLCVFRNQAPPWLFVAPGKISPHVQKFPSMAAQLLRSNSLIG